MSVVGRLSTGEAVELVAFDGQHLEIYVDGRAFAPGAPASIVFEVAPTPIPVGWKSHGSRKMPDGRFLARGRVISLTRELRDALLAAHASADD